VHFTNALHTAQTNGATIYLEIGPQATLTAMTAHNLTTTENTDTPPLLLPTLRRNHPEPETLTTTLATLHTRIAGLDPTALHTDTTARRVPLPTYPFQRRTYWVSGSAPGSGFAAASRFGLTWKDHPFLSGVVPVSGSGSTLFTGRVALSAYPWLADHAVSGSVLLPGTAVADLLLRVAEEMESGGVEELNLHVPLVLPERGGAQVQVVVEAPDEQGRRAVTVAARPEKPVRDGEEPEWTRHATGVLTPERPAASETGWAVGSWPPPKAEPVDVEELYSGFAAHGYGYGPAFTGLTGVWRRGGELFAEVRLPEAATGGGEFGIHPALFDAALHPWRAGGLLPDTDGSTLLPFAWQGITLYATGAEALRVRLAPAGDSAFSVQAADQGGAPVLALDALVLRPAVVGAGSGSVPMYGVDWRPVPRVPGPIDARGWSVMGPAERAETAALRALPGVQRTAHVDLAALRAALDTAAPVPTLVVATPGDAAPASFTSTDPVRACVGQGLALVQEWTADERLAEARLAIVTRGAVEAGEEDVPDLAGAALWGLLRSAQSEYPGRFTLIDLDDSPESRLALPAALASGESQLALRGGEMLTPVLAKLTPVLADPPTPAGTAEVPPADAGFDPDGTVLLTGCNGALGRRVAVHLARRHGVRRMLLVSRRGPDAPEAALLERELAESGVSATFAACDLADRADVLRMVATVPAEHPLTGVVHTAGVLDDGALAGLTQARIDTVLRSKADAVRHLHEATTGHPLRVFVLFSAAAGLLGRPGQASYAAANGVLDAFARGRRAAGLPGVSLAWGLWAERDGMAGGLDSTALRRLRRDGIVPMTPEQGLDLLDQALTVHREGPAVLVPLLLDSAALRRAAREYGTGPLPPLLRGLISSGPRPYATGTVAAGSRAGDGEAGGPAARLTALPPEERSAALLGLVTSQVADVLGHGSAAEIDPERPFREIGFDSLATVELRNRLGHLVGLRLPTTLAFDHPTPKGIAEWINGELPVTASASARDSLLTGIDEVTQAVAELASDDDRREAVRERLIGLLTALDAPAQPAGAAAGTTVVADRLDEATDEEIFAFLDEQL
ncbi:type I polyketide synthase, partial [Streptomyces sp. NPDC088116]|uniref:type I polyketide synthase n=1 Tax=Streptomyces sp. NPDC088116 TaxID=3365825 RepID=UPI0038057F39